MNNKIKIGIKIIFFLFSLSLSSAVFAATDTENVNLQVEVNANLSLDCGGSGTDPDVNFGMLTADTPVVGTSTCSVITNHEGGYDLFVDRTTNGDTSILKHTDGATYISDLAAWNGSNAAVWTGGATKGLGFRVQSVSGATKNDVWWGAATTCPATNDATALFAGIPQDPDTATPIPIMDHDTYSGGVTTTTMCYKLDVPTTQKSGVYSGDITYTVIGKP